MLVLGMAMAFDSRQVHGQGVAASASPWKSTVAAGPSFFYGGEANTIGLQLEAALLRGVRGDRTWLRADLSGHVYGMQPLYPCLLRQGTLCFSTSQRFVVGLGVAVQHVILPPTAKRDGAFYVIAGFGTYISTRKARHLPECQPDVGVCDATEVTARFTDTDIGANLGAGHTWTMGRNEVFLETRFHQLLWRQHKADPYSNYRLLPLTIGVRF